MTELAFSGLGLRPHAPIPANAFDRANTMAVRTTRVANDLGAPSVTVPAAGTAHGLSVGFMVTARDGAEHLALSIAAAAERAAG